MNAADDLLKLAAAWFQFAVKQHVADNPDQCGDWLALFQAGAAGAMVTVSIVPNQEISCGFQIGEKVIVFHKCPLKETRGPGH